MLFAGPVIKEIAQGGFYQDRGRQFYLSSGKLDSDYADVRFERELRLLRRFCARGAVLDVGCSTGGFLNQLRQRFPGDYQVCGTEICQPAAGYARRTGIEVSTESMLRADFGGRRFQAVTFWAVMEHLMEPEAYLKRAVELLSAGGHLIILVPNMGSLAVRILGRRYRYLLPEHVNYFTRGTLGRLVSKSSPLCPVAFGSVHFNPLVILQDLVQRVDYVSDEDRSALLRRTTRYKQSRLLLPVRAAYRAIEYCLGELTLADNLYVVCRKVR